MTGFDAFRKTTGSARDTDEWQARKDLAACYRLVALFGWSDLIATHISARVPGRPDEFLINPFGLAFDEITASSLLRIDVDGNLIGGPSAYGVNQGGFTIHSAIHQARHDAACVMHLHTPDGVAVSGLSEGLLPLNQTAMSVIDDLAYHDYEGPALHLEERERLQRDLGDKHRMVLRNHGTLTLGATVAEAFIRMYRLENACAIQVRTLAMGRPLCEASALSRQASAPMGSRQVLGPYAELVWPALLRKVHRKSPGFDT